jgi:hypothetical protein
MSFHSPYTARNVIISYAGQELSGGIPEDAFLTITPNAPRASFRKGLSGNTSASISSDTSYNIVLSLYPESQSATILQTFYGLLRAGELAGFPILGAGPLMIQDESNLPFFGAPQTVLMNVGESSYGADTGTIDFEFYVESGLVLTASTDDFEAAADMLLVAAATSALDEGLQAVVSQAKSLSGA